MRFLAILLTALLAVPAAANDYPAVYTAAGRVHLKAGELTASGADYVLTPAGSQPVSATLTSLAAQGAAAVADQVPYFTGAGIMALSGFTAYGRSLVAAVDATAAKVLLSLTKSDVGLSLVDNTADASKPISTLQAAGLALKANLAGGNTFSGNQTVGSGGRLILSGGTTSGQGNIQMGAAASASYDSNILYTDSTARTMGLICSSNPTFDANQGPWLAMRGTTYSVIAGQRGHMAMAPGNVSAPTGIEGAFVIYTGNNAQRMIYYPDGRIVVMAGATLAIGGGTALTKIVVYTPTLTPAAQSAGIGEQFFNVPGLTTADSVFVSPPSLLPDVALPHARVSAADTIAISFTIYSGTHTPPAGVYRILAVRS